MKTEILKAVSDETRIKIFQILSKGELCACELPGMVKVSQPAVSQHLQVLRDAGLVNSRRDGSKRLYSLSKKGILILKDISRW